MPANISSYFDRRLAYIYIWLSKAHKVVYVGQTNAEEGTLARAAQHVGPSGTLRKQFEEAVGLQLEQAADLIMLTFPLPISAEFIGLESSYREGVEYSVQCRLRDVRAELNPSFRVISNVRYSERSSIRLVQICALDIVDRFCSAYESLSPSHLVY